MKLFRWVCQAGIGGSLRKKGRRMIVNAGAAFLAASLTSLIAVQLRAQPTTTLKPETIEAFDGFVGTFEDKLIQSIEKGKPGLWMENPQQLATARSGEIRVRRNEDVPEIPGGIIHFWEGLVFIPGTTVEKVLDLLLDYDRHKEVYPEVIDSRLLSKSDNTVRGFLRLKKTKVLTVVLNTEHEARFFEGNDERTYLFSHSTRIAEVENPGEDDEEERPVGNDSGFAWRLNLYWAFEQEEDGVLADCASISLSRQIPWGLGWLIRPFVESTPRETLEELLQATRLALHQ